MPTEMVPETMTGPASTADDADAVRDVRVLLAGPDTLYFSCDIALSEAMRERLLQEKAAAQVAAKAGQVHCPEWLGARVLPSGAKGGYGLLVETADFTVKLLGAGIPNRPGMYLELRSHFLHVHPQGPAGACEAALAWVRAHLFVDQDAWLVERAIAFKAAKLSRADLHIDWQGGYAPTLTHVADDLRRFIRPGKTKWTFRGAGHAPTGYTFGTGDIQARLYNKTREVTEKANDAYFALLAVRAGAAAGATAGAAVEAGAAAGAGAGDIGDTWEPSQDVWRLEFELKRAGAKGFKLYAPPDVDDEDAILEAELSAEDLEHIGTLPRFFARMDEVFTHLTQHWLRLVVDNGAANRSRWPLDPTWRHLQAAFSTLAARQLTGLPELTGQAELTAPLAAETDAGAEGSADTRADRGADTGAVDGRELVRGARYSGRRRVLRRLELGLVKSLEVEDASPVSAALAALEQWSVRLVEKEEARAWALRSSAIGTWGRVPRWVEHGMGARLERVKQVRHRVQMLLGVAAAHGVLPLELKPAGTVGELLAQHVEALEQEAQQQGGVQVVLGGHYARLYKVTLPASGLASGRAAA